MEFRVESFHLYRLSVNDCSADAGQSIETGCRELRQDVGNTAQNVNFQLMLFYLPEVRQSTELS